MGRKKKFKRESKNLDDVKMILIVCEGTRTEPNYFNQYKSVIYGMEIETIGAQSNTYQVVEAAISKMSERKYDQVWAVFDKDSFPNEHIERARKLAKENNIKIAFSHECFELWYLLHFNYYNTAISRANYETKLTQIMRDKMLISDKEKYEKNSTIIFQLFEPYQESAIKNAKTLEKHHEDQGIIDAQIDKKRPYTSVYKLVEELNKSRRVRAI